MGKHKLTLPKADGTLKEIECEGSVLLIGANGSGKTRLGSWIDLESPEKGKVHRISAQKSLAMPDSTTPISIDKAEKDLLFGYADAPQESVQDYKIGHRWQSKPAVSLLNDYQKLMVYLFSDETEENAKYKAQQKLTVERVEPPVTKIDKVKQIWEIILPHRELVIGGLRIQTEVKGTVDGIYNSSEMSDGERVMFYLIGQCLAAPQNGLIIVDEPELHLHKSVQFTLWNEVEKLRSDCLFIYLTHDVDFATEINSATKIWIKSFDGKKWEWDIINTSGGLPEFLLLEILGSRKSVIFVEGDNGSYDVNLYREILDKYLVIPRGSCSQVIQSVKALKSNAQIHHLEVFGIVDRDRRVENEIVELEKDNIFVLEVAEVENLFCVKEIIEIVSNQLARTSETDFEKVKKYIFNRLKGELETQISMRVAGEIKHRLNCFNDKAKGIANLNNAMTELQNSININELYSEESRKFNEIISSNNYDELLKLYNRKSLASQISSALELNQGALPELVLRLLKTDKKEIVIDALKKYFGNFACKIN